MSRVDVIVPCYKYAHYLKDCVQSVLTQEGVDVRVLILDDASPDYTPEVGRRLVASDARVTYRRHAVNRGHIATYNEGLLEWASGDYCLLLSADDLLVPGALQRAANILDTHPQVGLCYGDVYVTEHPEQIVPEPEPTWSARIFSTEDFIGHACYRGGNPVPTPTAVLRTALQKRIGGYRPDLPHAGDMEMWLRCATEGPVAEISAHQAIYRRHPTNMHTHYGRWGDVQQRWQVIQIALEANAHRLENVHELRQSAAQAIAADALLGADVAFERGNLPLFRQFMQLATELDPQAEQQPLARRLMLKSRVGYRAWSLVRPLYRWAKRSPQTAAV